MDFSLIALESSFGCAFMRVHRNWLVNLAHVRELEHDGERTKVFVGDSPATEARGLRIPVACQRAAIVREVLLTNATDLCRP